MCEKGGTRRESIGVSKKDLEAIKSSKSRRQLPSNKLVSLPSNHSAVQSISQNALNLSLRQA